MEDNDFRKQLKDLAVKAIGILEASLEDDGNKPLQLQAAGRVLRILEGVKHPASSSPYVDVERRLSRLERMVLDEAKGPVPKKDEPNE
jgi:hypothetical protein